MNREIWKTIEEYPDYMVSNMGRVKSLEREQQTKNKWGTMGRKIKEKILKPTKTSGGYLRVVLCKDSICKTFLVHRLVAEAFLPNPDNLPQINHRDENKQNNNLENIEYCSAKYNSNYGTIKERISAKHKGKKLTSEHINKMANGHKKALIQYDKNLNAIAVWTSGKEAEVATGISASNICRVCKGKSKTAGGFIWKYNEKKNTIIC